MTQIQIIEGTWEELIKNHSAELAGHGVKVMILLEGKTSRLDQALAGLLDEADTFEVQAPDLSGRNNDLLEDELMRKYRNQGFEL